MISLDSWKPDEILKVFALLGSSIVFGIGLWQYRRAQQWKRAEWTAQEMKQLLSDPIVQAALLMIDLGSRNIPLYPDRDTEADRYVFLNDDEIAHALKSHEDREDGFSALEADIRSAFDRLLDGLERFESYVTTGLVTEADLAAYLKYWASEICVEARPGTEDRLIQLRLYMKKYGFAGADKLLMRIAKQAGTSRRRSMLDWTSKK